MHELKRTIHRIGVSRSSRPTVYLLCRSSYYSTSTCVHRHQQKPSVEQSIPLMHSEKTIGNAPIKLLSQNSHIAVGNFGNRPSERSDRSTPRQTTHRGATASSSSWLGKSSPAHHTLYLFRRFNRSAQSFPEPTRGFTGVRIGTRYRVIVNSTE